MTDVENRNPESTNTPPSSPEAIEDSTEPSQELSETQREAEFSEIRLNEITDGIIEHADLLEKGAGVFDENEDRLYLSGIDPVYLECIAYRNSNTKVLSFIARFTDDINVMTILYVNPFLDENGKRLLEEKLNERLNSIAHPMLRRRSFGLSSMGQITSGMGSSREDFSSGFEIGLALYASNAGPHILAVDPSIALFESIQDTWIISELGNLGELEIYNWKGIIARNLYFKGAEVTEENCIQAINEIRETRETYQDVTLFRDRNVLFLAHNELVNEGIDPNTPNRFGTTATIDAISSQTPTSLDIMRLQNSEEDDLIELKRAFLARFVEMEPPMTMVFDGHGLPEAINFADTPDPLPEGYTYDQLLSLYCISATELSTALIERYQRYPELNGASPEQRDILIIHACFSQNFLRDIYERMSANGLQMPIIMNPAEYNQMATGNYSSYGSNFFESTLNLSTESHISTIGDIIRGDVNLQVTNPSLFIPQGSVPQQISETENGNDTDQSAA